MASDITRRTFDPKKRYAGVVKQQGRVTLDADDNEALAISLEDERLNNLHIIGPSGTPDDGFRISDAEVGDNGQIDFKISGGTIYVGGLRYYSEYSEEEQTFQDQSGWHEHDTTSWPEPPSGSESRTDLVYLLLWQQEVTAVEDQELIEPALVDIDTSTRVRTMGQICVMATDAEDCELAWAELGTSWDLTSEEQEDFRETAEITTDARLRVSFNCIEIDQEGGLCADHAREGYLYADNQAIRVQIQDEDNLVWGFDNASGLYRISLSGTTVTFETLPRDEEHYPRVGQVVEVLRWTDDLPNEGKIAALTGHLSTVASPSYDSETKTFELDVGCPSGWENDEVLYLRVWEEQIVLEDAIDPDNPVALGATGVCITLSGTQFREGDYWTIGVRPETPQEVYPKSLMDEDGEPPHGIRRFACPLALLHWEGVIATIDPCLEPFNNLVELTRVRQGTCCKVTVGDGVTSVGMYDDIQTAVNELLGTGGEVCILPGNYVLDNSVIVDGEDTTIQGCGRQTYITISGIDSAAFVVSGKNNVLTDLSVSSQCSTRGTIHIDDAEKCHIHGNVILNHFHLPSEGTSIGITGNAAFSSYSEENLIISRNRIEVGSHAGSQAISVYCPKGLISDNSCYRGGIQILGRSYEVVLRGNDIFWARENGITLGSISGGYLSDITISRNSIKHAQRNGIGVAEFFDLDNNPQFITTDRLQIVENEITECVSDTELSTEDIPLDYAAFGGIVLADGEEIVIRENRITNNGGTQTVPVCGIFLLHTQGVEISNNTVLYNGGLYSSVADNMAGYQGGILLASALQKPVYLIHQDGSPPMGRGYPAAKIADNVVIAPWGHALLVQAIGPVSVSGNSFKSLGSHIEQVTVRKGGAVHIVNLGESSLGEEYETIGSRFYLKTYKDDLPWYNTLAADEDIQLQMLHDGQVSFVNNQVSMGDRASIQDVLTDLRHFDRAATLIYSLDTVIFSGNQLSCEDVRHPIYANGLVVAVAATAIGNTFKERNWQPYGETTESTSVTPSGKSYEVNNPIIPIDILEPSLQLEYFSYYSWAVNNIAANNYAEHSIGAEGPQEVVKVNNIERVYE